MLKGDKMNNVIRLKNDARDIEAVIFQNDWEHKVGRYGVTKIVHYRELMEVHYPTWIAVYKGDEIYARIPAYQVSIYYKIEKEK